MAHSTAAGQLVKVRAAATSSPDTSYGVLAFGSRISLTTALVIVVGNALLSGAAPTPGGVGVSAAVLTAGLVGAGVDQNTAFAVTVTYRPASFFVPPFPGFFSPRWLERNGHL